MTDWLVDLKELREGKVRPLECIVRCEPTAEPVVQSLGIDAAAIVAGCFSLAAGAGGTPHVPEIVTPPSPARFLQFLLGATPNTMQRAAKLWGLSCDASQTATWNEIRELIGPPVEKPAPLWAKRFIDRRLAAWDGDHVYLPLPVLAALVEPDDTMTAGDFLSVMQAFRKVFSAGTVLRRDPNLYREMVRFVEAPTRAPSEFSLFRCIRLSPALADLQYADWMLPAFRAFVLQWEQVDAPGLKAAVTLQMPLWRAFGESLSGLVDLAERAKRLTPAFRDADYGVCCKGVAEAAGVLADAYYCLGQFERRMGVDRYMAPALVKPELDQLHELVHEVRRTVNQVTDRHRTIFQHEWGNHRVSEIVHRLFGMTEPCPFLSRFPTGQSRVILLVVDGLGYTQYRWNRRMSEINRQATFGGSVLDWLSCQPEYQDEWILGAPWITDTGAGLSQIFSGQPSWVNGIYSSQMFDVVERRSKDVKSLPPDEFAQVVPGPSPSSFFNSLPGVKVRVFTPVGNARSEQGFRNRNFGDHTVVPVDLPERFSEVMLDEIEDHPPAQRHLEVVYYPLIDRHGHALGSFSSFELHEYERFNQLLSSFLLQLLHQHTDWFDGATTIALVADHGMFETSSSFVTLEEVKDRLERVGVWGRVTIANRAIFLHSVRVGDQQTAEQALRDLLRTKHIEAQVFARSHPAYKRFMYDADDRPPHLPDVVALFRGEGLALTRPIAKSLLHFGGHGGCSTEEVFVPFITVNLTESLRMRMQGRYGNMV